MIGTFNKISEYSGGIFRDLHYQCRLTLRNSDRLVICGYGFGDKGINSEILKWFFAKRGRRFLIIHPDPENLISNARGAIRKYWEEPGQVSLKEATTLIPKRLEEVATEEFLARI